MGDHIWLTHFDSTKYFDQASVLDIIKLLRCYWGGDYQSELVAMYMSNYDEDVSQVLRDSGMRFECHILESDKALDYWFSRNDPVTLTGIDDILDIEIAKRFKG